MGKRKKESLIKSKSATKRGFIGPELPREGERGFIGPERGDDFEARTDFADGTSTVAEDELRIGVGEQASLERDELKGISDPPDLHVGNRQERIDNAEKIAQIGLVSNAFTGVGALVAGGFQAQALKLQGLWQRNQHEFNAEMAQKEAKQIREIGKKEAVRQGQRDSKLLGQQRVALAAQGIVVDEGSALDIQEETRDISNEDQMTIVNNARRSAMGLEMDALQSRVLAQNAELTGRIKGSQARSEAFAKFGQSGLKMLDSLQKSSKVEDKEVAEKAVEEVESAKLAEKRAGRGGRSGNRKKFKTDVDLALLKQSKEGLAIKRDMGKSILESKEERERIKKLPTKLPKKKVR
jgi:hypothetical protein